MADQNSSGEGRRRQAIALALRDAHEFTDGDADWHPFREALTLLALPDPITEAGEELALQRLHEGGWDLVPAADKAPCETCGGSRRQLLTDRFPGADPGFTRPCPSCTTGQGEAAPLEHFWPPEKDPPEACPSCGVTRREGEATFEEVPCPGCTTEKQGGADAPELDRAYVRGATFASASQEGSRVETHLCDVCGERARQILTVPAPQPSVVEGEK